MQKEYIFRKIETDGMSPDWPWCLHRRSKNWLCIATGKNAANVVRIHCAIDRAEEEYDVSAVKPGDALECGCEYTSCRGKSDYDRRYYTAVAIAEHKGARYLVLDEFKTLAQAMRARGVVLSSEELTAALEQFDTASASS